MSLDEKNMKEKYRNSYTRVNNFAQIETLIPHI